MMSNSNYSIGLQRLKPVYTAYCGLHNLAETCSWARDISGRDRDETETLTIFLETRPRRDVGTSRDRLETETSRPRPQPCHVATDKPPSPPKMATSSGLFLATIYNQSQLAERKHV